MKDGVTTNLSYSWSMFSTGKWTGDNHVHQCTCKIAIEKLELVYIYSKCVFCLVEQGLEKAVLR